MADALEEKKISELDEIPSSWDEQTVLDFLLEKGLLAVADAEGLNEGNTNTYKVSLGKLVEVFKLREMQEAITIALGMKDGCASLVFVDSDKGTVSELDDGKTLKYALSNINEALQKNTSIIMILGSSEKEEIIENVISSKVIINLNSNLNIVIPDDTIVQNNLCINSKGSVTLGEASYGSSVTYVSVKASSITARKSSVRLNLVADSVSLLETDGVVDVKARNVNIGSTESNAVVNVTTNTITFNDENSINGKINARAMLLNTYPINVVGGLLMLSIGGITMLDSSTHWLNVDSTEGAKVCAFINDKPSFYEEETDHKGYITNHENEIVNITYAGVFPSLYDAIVNTQEELKKALADGFVKSIFLNGSFVLESTYEIVGGKVVYGAFKSVAERYVLSLVGGTFGTEENPVNISFTVPVNSSNNSATSFYGAVRFTDILGTGTISMLSGTIISEGYYERNSVDYSTVRLNGFTQSYWYTSVIVPEYIGDYLSGGLVRVEELSEKQKQISVKTKELVQGMGITITATDTTVEISVTQALRDALSDVVFNEELDRQQIADLQEARITIEQDIEEIKEDIQDIEEEIQTEIPKSKTEVVAGDNIAVTKSVSGVDGHDIYTVSGVESVPKVAITSNDDSIAVFETLNPETNTKTFDLAVNKQVLHGRYYTYATTVSGRTRMELLYDYGNIDLFSMEIGLYNVVVFATVKISESSLSDDTVTINLECNDGDSFYSKNFLIDGSDTLPQQIFDSRTWNFSGTPNFYVNALNGVQCEVEFSVTFVSTVGGTSSLQIRRLVDDCSLWQVSNGVIQNSTLGFTLVKSSEDSAIDTLKVDLPNAIFCDIKNVSISLTDTTTSETYTITNLLFNLPTSHTESVLQQSCFQIDFVEDSVVTTKIMSNNTQLLARNIPDEYTSNEESLYQFSITNGCAICAEFIK